MYMDAIKTYGNYIKQYSEAHPAVSRKMIDVGLRLEQARVRFLSDKRMPSAYRMLNSLAVRMIRKGLANPKDTAWTNLFSPVEILQCFDLNCLSLEAISSFFSGFTIEDHFINLAEGAGIAPTLCSYHKCFLGAMLSGVLPVPRLATTTSTVCDANFNTFRLAQQKTGLPVFYLDIPAEESPDSIRYTVLQLEKLISFLEEHTKKKFDIDRLREMLRRENLSHKHYLRYYREKKTRSYPTTLTLQMYELFATHLSIGSEESLRFFRSLHEEIKAFPEFHGKRLWWVHLLPFYHPILKDTLNFSEDYQIQGFEMNLDYTKELDENRPLESLAKKMIRNLYNRPFQEKQEFVVKAAKALNCDGVIHFCHWGCKQSIGGVTLIKEAFDRAGIPMLILDGDGIDRRNDMPGQIKTRLEAFLEVLD